MGVEDDADKVRTNDEPVPTTDVVESPTDKDQVTSKG